MINRPNHRFEELILNRIKTKNTIADKIAKVFKNWYENKIHLNEFTLDVNYRLIELNRKFDWKRLEEIKTHNNK